ncbi:MAG: hypothetical protein JSW00_16545 [Thermoplasmata archaeon]|nr:MAG: hypothetical protein JSW00_16545 [Thermoplasmata archaeon]
MKIRKIVKKKLKKAIHLGIGKTTARRLVLLYQKDDEQGKVDPKRAGCNRKVNGTFIENEDQQEAKTENSKNQVQDDPFPSNDYVQNRMPKTFQISNSLPRKDEVKTYILGTPEFNLKSSALPPHTIVF